MASAIEGKAQFPNAAGSSRPELHVSRQGERIADVARQHQVSQRALLAHNPQIRDPALPLSAGEELAVPQDEDSRLAPYRVDGGESLEDVAARFGLDPAQVASENGLVDHDGGIAAHAVYPGAILLLPARAQAEAMQQMPAGGASFSPMQGDTLATGAVGQTASAAPASEATLEQLNTLTGDYENAQAARLEADQRLAQMLTENADLLVDPQARDAFVANYRAEHAEIYEAEVEAAQAQQDFMAANADALDAAAMRDPAVAEAVVDAYTQLAGSPLPAAATEWAARIGADPALAAAYAPFAQHIADEIIAVGLPGTLVQYQAEAGGDGAAALERFEALFKGYKDARSFYDQVNGFGDLVDDAQRYLDAMGAALRGDIGPLEALLSTPDELSRFGSMGMAMSAATLAFAVANLSERQGFDLVQTVGSMGEAGLDVVIRVIGSLEAAGRLTSWPRLTSAAQFAQGRVLPGLAVALSALSTIDALGDFARDPTLENATVLVSSAMSLVGAGLILFPPTAPIGAILSVAALGIGLLGTLVFGEEARNDFNQERDRLLEQTLTELYGDQPGAAEAIEFIMDNAGTVGNYGHAFDLSTQELIDLARDYPELFDVDYTALDALIAIGIDGESLRPFLATLDEQGLLEDFIDAAYMAVQSNAVGSGTGAPGARPEAMLAKIRSDMFFELEQFPELIFAGLTSNLAEHRRLIDDGYSDNDPAIIALETQILQGRRQLDAIVEADIAYEMSIVQPDGETLGFDASATLVAARYPEGSAVRAEVDAAIERLRAGNGL